MVAEVRELCLILTRPHMRALFDSHDQLANGEYIPQTHDIESLPGEDTAIKIVRLVKGKEPLVCNLLKLYELMLQAESWIIQHL